MFRSPTALWAHAQDDTRRTTDRRCARRLWLRQRLQQHRHSGRLELRPRRQRGRAGRGGRAGRRREIGRHRRHPRHAELPHAERSAPGRLDALPGGMERAGTAVERLDRRQEQPRADLHLEGPGPDGGVGSGAAGTAGTLDVRPEGELGPGDLGEERPGRQGDLHHPQRPQPRDGQARHAHRRPLRARPRRPRCDRGSGHSGWGRQRRRIQAHDRKLHVAVKSLYVEPAQSAEVHWGALECHDVFKIYRSGPVETVALRGLDLRVETGDVVAILGPSGCGKSTLLALAAGLEEPSAGELRVWGRSLGRLSEAELAAYRARDLAIVFQSDNLWPALSAQENVAISLRLSGHGDAEAEAAQSLAAFGLRERHSHRAAALSGGEQQRVAIAAAAARRARDRDARREGRVMSAATGAVRTPTALVSCEDVTVAYGEGEGRVSALDHVDLTVEPGQRVTLWGRSGSGKTTLLHVLGGLVVPTSGRVMWGAEELSVLDDAARGRTRAAGIAYIFQG